MAQASTATDATGETLPSLTGTEVLDDGEVIAWSPVLGDDDRFEVGQAEVSFEESLPGTEDQSSAMTALAAVSCGTSTRVLEKFSSKYDGTIKLECGTATGYGLKHI